MLFYFRMNFKAVNQTCVTMRGNGSARTANSQRQSYNLIKKKARNVPGNTNEVVNLHRNFTV